VLGAGGSARAVVWALGEAGAAEVSIWNRTAERAVALADDLDARAVTAPRSADLIVNCTSVGIDRGVGRQEAVAAVGLAAVDPPETFFDLTYGAEATPLASWAADGGARVVDGLEMLVRQGARSLERWTARPAPLAAMRAGARGA
jgi:shikimate dehydrogenase